MLTPLALTWAKLVVMALLGTPIAALLDPDGRLFYLTGGQSREFLWTSYAWSCYAVVVMVILAAVARLNARLGEYQLRPVVELSDGEYLSLWALAFAGAVGCVAVLFVQNGYSHPGLATWGLDAFEVARRRIAVWQRLNMNVYNLGVHLFSAFTLIISGLFLRNKVFLVLSLTLFAVLVTFSLAKSPIADTVVELTFVYLVLRRPSWTVLPVVFLAVVGALGLMAWLTRWAGDLADFATALGVRLVWGSISDLPHYFNYFSQGHIGLVALLPPYVQNLLGASEPSAARLVVEFSNTSGVRLGVAGVANTFFIGEAYAVAGVLGVLLSPVIVAAEYAGVIWLFRRLRKDAVTVFLFGYLLDRMTSALFSGFSSFVLSSMHLVLGAFLYLVFLYISVPAPSPLRQRGT